MHGKSLGRKDNFSLYIARMMIEEIGKPREQVLLEKLDTLRTKALGDIVNNMVGQKDADDMVQAAQEIFDELCKEAVEKYEEKVTGNASGPVILQAVEDCLKRDDHLSDLTAKRLGATIVELEELSRERKMREGGGS